ncbi:MAG: Hpt domain-containing protein [Deltaproteobacteria bacterium]|nr:Hpt domain-containing protein [Deltaproteobacteria bacterium]
MDFDIDNMSMMDIFKMESSEHIEEMHQMLRDLKANPSDNSIIERLFRRVHTLTGAARVVELTEVQIIAHALETPRCHARVVCRSFR